MGSDSIDLAHQIPVFAGMAENQSSLTPLIFLRAFNKGSGN